MNDYIQMIVGIAKTNMKKLQDHLAAAGVFKRISDHPAAAVFKRISDHPAAGVFKRIGDHPAAGVFKGIGDYPAEYNPKVHGPYDPARFYGTPSTPFSELKLCEVPQWLKSRNKSPKSLAALFSRAYWRWSHQYVQPKRTTAAPLIQGLTGMMLIFYIINYGKTIRHRNYKYH